MLSILAIRTYRHLFFAQVIALVGTGLATVALGLLAWKIAGSNAGLVLGTALSHQDGRLCVTGPDCAGFR